MHYTNTAPRVAIGGSSNDIGIVNDSTTHDRNHRRTILFRSNSESTCRGHPSSTGTEYCRLLTISDTIIKLRDAETDPRAPIETRDRTDTGHQYDCPIVFQLHLPASAPHPQINPSLPPFHQQTTRKRKPSRDAERAKRERKNECHSRHGGL